MQFQREHAAELGHAGHEGLSDAQAKLWHEHVRTLDADLRLRAAEVFARLAVEELVARGPTRDPGVKAAVEAIRRHRERPAPRPAGNAHDGGMVRVPGPPPVPPVPEVEAVQMDLTARFARSIVLWKKERSAFDGFGSELDRAVQMPGWTNIWTMPI